MTASTAAATGSNDRASRSGSARATCSSGHRACDSRRVPPRRTPAVRAVDLRGRTDAEREVTRELGRRVKGMTS